MTDNNVDKYITGFKQLAFRSNQDPDAPSILKMFASGLPKALAHSCLDNDDPDTFDEWTMSAQKNHRIWLKKRSLAGIVGTVQTARQQTNNAPQRGQFYWRRGGGGQQPRSGNNRSNPRQSTPYDPNAMDTSAAARKAISEEDKQRHRQEGRCFECSERGHLACTCPKKKPRVRATTEAPVKEETPTAKIEEDKEGEALAEKVLEMSDEAIAVFVKKMSLAGQELGFLDA
jgi:hypothetical protein